MWVDSILSPSTTHQCHAPSLQIDCPLPGNPRLQQQRLCAPVNLISFTKGAAEERVCESE